MNTQTQYAEYINYCDSHGLEWHILESRGYSQFFAQANEIDITEIHNPGDLVAIVKGEL